MNNKISKNDVIKKLDKCLNKTLGQVDKNKVFEKVKSHPKITGIAGSVIEQSVFEYSADNKQRPDLIVDGIEVELKTTGIKYSKKNKKEYEAKEPMSVTAVSPEKIVCEEFLNSNFWHKLEHLLFVYYLYDSQNVVTSDKYAEFIIKGYHFHEFSEVDKKILEQDWTSVREFIVNLKRDYTDYKTQLHRLSSELRDTLMFIDTAPKWPNHPRFRIKRSLISNIVKKHFGNKLEQLPTVYLNYEELYAKLKTLTNLYKGKSIRELMTLFGMTVKIDKSISEKIIIKMFGGNSSKMNNVDLFNKIGLKGKSIVITKKQTRTEDIKLFPLDFEEIKDEKIEFDNSNFKLNFTDNKYLYIIFEEQDKQDFSENKFLGFKEFTFSEEFIETHVKKVWEEIRDLVLNDKLKDVEMTNLKTKEPIRNKKTGKIKSAPNFPKSKDNTIFLRGTGKDSTTKPQEVNGVKMYKQYVWIKGLYITDKLAETDMIE